MAFKSSAATAAATAPSNEPKPVGGRYAGIKPPQEGIELLKPGEYILELLGNKGSRKGTTAMVQCKVLQSEGDGATKPGPDIRQFMINFGGKSFDSGISRIISLSMAVCQCATMADFERDEPQYEELIDLICAKRVDSKTYGDAPLAGRKVYARGWAGAQLAGMREPFVNWEFAIPEE